MFQVWSTTAACSVPQLCMVDKSSYIETCKHNGKRVIVILLASGFVFVEPENEMLSALQSSSLSKVLAVSSLSSSGKSLHPLSVVSVPKVFPSFSSQIVYSSTKLLAVVLEAGLVFSNVDSPLHWPPLLHLEHCGAVLKSPILRFVEASNKALEFGAVYLQRPHGDYDD